MIDVVQRRESVSELFDGGDFLEAQVASDIVYGSLTDDQHVFVVVVVEKLEWGMAHDNLVFVDLHAQPRRQLVGLALAQGVARVGHKHGRHAEFAVVVDQPLEGVRSEGKHILAPHNHAVDVEKKPKVRNLSTTTGSFG